MKIKIALLSIIALIYVSCKSRENITLFGTMKDAREKIISEILKHDAEQNDFYKISNQVETENYYVFIIEKNIKVGFDSTGVVIGKKSNLFPTKYFEKDKVLFFWKDSTEVLTKKTYDKLLEYKAINLSFVSKTGHKKIDSLLDIIHKTTYKNYEEFEKDKTLDELTDILEVLHDNNQLDAPLRDLYNAIINDPNETIKKTYYFVCKNNIRKLKSHDAKWIDILQYNKLKCKK